MTPQEKKQQEVEIKSALRKIKNAKNIKELYELGWMYRLKSNRVEAAWHQKEYELALFNKRGEFPYFD